ncbi:MAG TPA: hypothetical protein VFY87_23150, partial [Geminicoccaceae bacterium]|nr:hypothetical protein [Geminicoccaceae bacterium]
MQRKWRERGEALLAEAQAVLRRQEEERTKLARQVDRERNGYLADVANPYLTSVVQSVRVSLPRRRGRVAKVDLFQPGGEACPGRDAGSRRS